MVEFFKTVDGRITEVSEFTEGCWVNMVHPSSDELGQIAQAAQVEEEFVRAALDPEKSAVDTALQIALRLVEHLSAVLDRTFLHHDIDDHEKLRPPYRPRRKARVSIPRTSSFS